jgi:glycosyltransferase involved in cell wall biosynthesis
MKRIIVQVVQHLRPGGIETMALDLMRQLNNQCEIHIFSLEGDIQQAIAHWPRLEKWQHRLHFFNKKPGIQPTLVWNLYKCLKQLNASSIHSHHIGPLFYGGFAAKLAKIPNHIHTEHDAWHLNHKASCRLQKILIQLQQPTLVADCDAVAKEMQFYLPNTKPQVILNGIDVKRFIPAQDDSKKLARQALNLPEKLTIIGCAARLETVKGHQYLLKALCNIPDQFVLALAGEGSLRAELEDKAKELGVEHRVVFLGSLNNMITFYQAIDVFCLPSLNEGLPLSPLEAQASGIPVIISNVGGCKSIVDADSGQLVPAGDVKALENAISNFQHNKPSQNPRNFVLRNATLERTANAYFSLFNSQVNKPTEI